MRARVGRDWIVGCRFLGDEVIAGGDDILDLIADMVHAAGLVALKKGGDRRILAERLQQLYLGIGQFDENGGNAVIGLGNLLRYLGAQRFLIDLGRGGNVRHGDRNMVQTANHGHPIPSRS